MNAKRTLTPAAALLAASLAMCGSAVAQSHSGDPTLAPQPAQNTAAPAAPAANVCRDCGVVEAIRTVEQKGEASGVGAVAGGVLGGVLGHQIGSGRGNTVATIAGAGAGAYAGHQIEKNHNRKTSWNVTLRMDDGRARTLTYTSQPTVRQGDRVKLVDGGRRLALLAN